MPTSWSAKRGFLISKEHIRQAEGRGTGLEGHGEGTLVKRIRIGHAGAKR
jgi:hypothetical protein